MRGACLRFGATTSTTEGLDLAAGVRRLNSHASGRGGGGIGHTLPGGLVGVGLWCGGAVSGRGVDQQFGGLGALDNVRDLETEGYRRSSKGAPLGGGGCSP